MTEAVQVEAPKRTPTVITSETAEAFYDAQLGVTPEPEPAGVAKETPKDDADEEIRKESKGNKKIESRFSELAKARREAEERAKTAADEAKKAREDREAIQAERDALKAKYEPPKTDPLGPEPQPEQFADPKEYGAALKDWTTEKLERERVDKEANEKRGKEWREKVETARKEVDGYDEKIATSKVMLSPDLTEAVFDSDVGPRLLAHFADHPEVAEELNRLPEKAMQRRIGKLEAKLAEPPTPTTPLAEVGALKEEISRAPAPITPLRSSAGSDVPRVGGDGKYHGTYEQYKADRLAGKIK